MAGVTGSVVGSLMKNKALGQKMMIGGAAAVIGKTVANIRSEGIGAFGLRGMGYDDAFSQNAFTNHGMLGNMGDFVSPYSIQNSVQSAGAIAQYSMPNANAQYAPMAPQMQMAPGQQPMGQPQMADYMEGNAVGAMLDQTSGMNY